MSIDVLGYLQKRGFEYTVRGTEAVMNCPFCEDREKKFSINLETGAWNCLHVNRCGLKGSLFDLKRRLGDARIIDHPKTYQRPKPAGTDPSEKAIAWLGARGLKPEVVKAYGIRQKDSALVFPYFRCGELINNKYRTGDKKMWQEPDAEQVLFGRDLVPPAMRELVVTEGEIDAMSLHQLGLPNVVSVPGGAGNLAWIETEWDWLARFDTVFLAFDMDAAGGEGAQKAAHRLGLWRCRRVVMPQKDANDWLRAGATGEAVVEALVQAKDCAPLVVKAAEDYFDDLLRGERTGTKTGFPTLDHLLGGLRPSEVTVWTGRNGDGKTTFLNQLVLNLLSSDPAHRACIGSFEMRPQRLLRWLAYQAGVQLSRDGLTQLGKITDGRLFLLDTQEEIGPDTILEAFEYLARRYGVQTFIIDSLLRVNLGGGGLDWLEKQKAFMNRLTQFALTFEAHLHLVAHPRKATTDGARVDKVDIAGSGDISNLASNVICLRRIDKEDQKQAALEVMKNRELGRLGVVMLTFDESRRCFAEANTPPATSIPGARVLT